MDTLLGALELALWSWCLTPPKPPPAPRDRPDRWEVDRAIRGGGSALPPDPGDPLDDRRIDG